jgi:photosystem II stability/assembly factor-like uncharacterized protein
VYLYGLRGHLFFSADGGESWDPVDAPTASLLTDGIHIGGDAVLFTGMGGTMLIGESAGRGVELLQRPGREGLAGALDAGDDVLVIFGESGVSRMPRSVLEAPQ